MSHTTIVRPEDYRIALPLILTLGEQIGMHMERHYGVGFLFNRVLTGVEQLPQLAVTFPPGILIHNLPSTTMHAMRRYVIEEAEDHAYWVAEGDTRLWRYLWLSHCGALSLRVEVEPPRLITAGTRLEVCSQVPPWCRLCQGCARKEEHNG